MSEETTPEVVEPTATEETLAVAAETETTETTETTTPTESAQSTAPADPKPTETTPEVQPEPDTTEEVAARLVPDAKDYVLQEGVPEHVAQFAHDNDMTQEQLDATLKSFGDFTRQAEVGKQAVMREEGDKLVQSWGNMKNTNLSIVTRALSQNDPDGQLTELMNVSGFGNHPAVLNFFLNVGNSMREGGFLKGSVNTPKGTTTAATAMFGNSHPSAN